MTTRITIDYTLAMHEGAGDGGLSDPELDALAPAMERAVQPKGLRSGAGDTCQIVFIAPRSSTKMEEAPKARVARPSTVAITPLRG